MCQAKQKSARNPLLIRPTPCFTRERCLTRREREPEPTTTTPVCFRVITILSSTSRARCLPKYNRLGLMTTRIKGTRRTVAGRALLPLKTARFYFSPRHNKQRGDNLITAFLAYNTRRGSADMKAKLNVSTSGT